ncbi:class A beta-lactamase-related serine hydrolase [Arachnia propionica]|uniref:Class A beta-lactamase-related serine hydrolase n=1 Tax=Arachnia propionica TaxID=1750 RepID=A0A3P1TBC6_9ACTN|nr:serine hydrolase domain-containing protein [Arachnia propionica]RRD06699.1 class A beta-lactamase-related serine hydrolase [Arachnia propionica]
MRNTRRLLGLLMIGILALLSACSSPPTPPPPPVEPPAETHELTKTDLDAWLDGTLPDVLTKGKATGAVVTVVKDGQILTNRGYGNEKLGDNGQPDTPVNPETTIFRWGSISKVPTAIAVMQLVEQGKLDLDADITTYTDVPIQKHHKEPITLRHLLTHTAGFEESTGTVNPALKNMPLAEYVHHNPPVSVYRPGTIPAYSNYGITLAGYLVEQASGQPFHDYMKEHVLSPAGMTTASYDQPLPEETLALAYDDTGQPHPFQTIPDVPAGTLSGSGTDAAAFMLTQLNHSPQLLTPDSWEQMWTPALTEDTLGNLANSPRMGLGYFTGFRNGHRTVQHGGDLRNHHSQFEIYPDDQVGIFISFTDDGSFSDATASLRDDLLNGFANRYLPAQTTAQTPQLEGSTERAHQVAGTYVGSRAPVTTWLSAWYNTVQQMQIQALPNGNLLLQDREFVEIAPWIWKNPHTDGLSTTLTARVVDGKVEAVGVGPALTLLPTTPTGQALLPVFIISLAIFALALLAWVAGAIRRRVRARRGKPTAGLPRLAHLTRIGALTATLALIGWVSVSLIILIGQNFDLLGNITLLRTIQVLQWAGIITIIPASLDLITAIKSRAGWKRITMAVLLLAALGATAWWAWAGNALNPNLGA